MPLTPEEIAAERKRLGIPTEGFGRTVAPAPSVEERIAQFRQNVKAAEPEPSAFESFAGGVGDLFTGAAKGVGSTIAGIGELGQKGLSAVTGPAIEALGGTVPTGERPEALEEALTPEGLLQQIGFTAEQIAEFALPAAKIGKITKGLGLARTAGIEALTGGAVATLQEGEVGEEALVTGAVSGLLPFIGAAGKSLLKPTGLIRKALGLKPSQIKKIDKIAKQGGFASVDDFVLEKGFKGSRDDIADQAAQLFNTSRESKKAILEGITKKTSNNHKPLLQEVRKAFDFPGQEAVVREIDELIATKSLTAIELDRIRFLADDILPRSAFTDITPKKTEGLQRMIDPIRKRLAILDETGAIKKANADIRVLYQLIPGVEDAAKKSLINKIGVSSIIKGAPSILATTAFPGAGPALAAANIASLITEVPQVASRLAQFLKKASEKEGIEVIQQLIKSATAQQAKTITGELTE